MNNTDSHTIVDEYINWLRNGLSVDQINGVCELTTPFLDRHNDHLQIYVEKKGDKLLLSDDGYILSDLEASGMVFNTVTRKQILRTIINGLGVKIDGSNRIFSEASKATLGKKIHSLIQAMIAVNDTFVLSSPQIKSIFFEDVRKFLKEKNVRFSPRVKLAGKSGYDHAIDFLIPASNKEPERLVQAINRPSKNTISQYLFVLGDTIEERSEGSKAIAVLNDEAGKISGGVLEALESYSIKPVFWSERNTDLEVFLN